jgi:hypothetical protein
VDFQDAYGLEGDEDEAEEDEEMTDAGDDDESESGSEMDE